MVSTEGGTAGEVTNIGKKSAPEVCFFDHQIPDAQCFIELGAAKAVEATCL